MGQFVAALHAAHLNRLDKDVVDKKLWEAWTVLSRRDIDGAGVFAGAPFHHWTGDAKLFYIALRLDGWKHDEASLMVDHATRAR